MNKELFLSELEKIGIYPTELQLFQLHRYYELLVEWNEKMNLTGITEESQVYLKHFYDSATLIKGVDLTKEETLCDVGTGAGFPGMVLKILFPHLQVSLVDSLKKRLLFLDVVIKELGLTGIETVHARAEEYARFNRECFDVVTARAVAPLSLLMEYCIPLVKVGKYFVPMKAILSEELEQSKKAIQVLGVSLIHKEEFVLPIELSGRTILTLRKNQKTNLIYPRNYGEMKKKPL